MILNMHIKILATIVMITTSVEYALPPETDSHNLLTPNKRAAPTRASVHYHPHRLTENEPQLGHDDFPGDTYGNFVHRLQGVRRLGHEDCWWSWSSEQLS